MPNKRLHLDHRFRSAWIFAFVLSFLSTGVCFAKDLIVDGKSAPPGTPTPARSRRRSRPSRRRWTRPSQATRVLVRGGVYHEGVAFKRSGIRRQGLE